MQLSRALAIASLAFAIIFYALAVGGILWPATKPNDVGVLSVSGVFAVFGILGLLLKPVPTA